MKYNDEWKWMTPEQRLKWFKENGVNENVAVLYLDRKGFDRYQRVEGELAAA